MLHAQNENILWSGMFLDKSLENEFQQLYLSLRKEYSRKIALIAGSLYLSFLIFDFVSLKTFPIVITVLACRLIFFIISLLLYLRWDRFLKSSAFLKITIYEFAFIASFFTIIAVYEEPSFLFQSLAINVQNLCT